MGPGFQVHWTMGCSRAWIMICSWRDWRWQSRSSRLIIPHWMTFSPDAVALVVGQQLVEGREVEDALAEKVVAELLPGDVALEVDQFALAEVEAAHAIVLLQHQLPAGGFLPQGPQEDGQVLGREGQGPEAPGRVGDRRLCKLVHYIQGRP